MVVNIANIKSITESDEKIVKQRLNSRYERALNYKIKDDYYRSIAASKLILLNFPDILDSDIKQNEYGKPYIDGKDNFSISHSGDYSVLIRSRGIVGIDIQQIRSQYLHVSKKVFTENELGYFSKNPIDNFYLLWTAKEAVMKALGKGFNISPRSFDVIDAINGECICVESTKLYINSVKYEDLYISVASDEKTHEIRLNHV